MAENTTLQNPTVENPNSKYIKDLDYLDKNVFKNHSSNEDEHRTFYHSYNDLANSGKLKDIDATNKINDIWAKRGSSSARTLSNTLKGDGVSFSDFLKSPAGSSITSRPSARDAIYDVYGASDEVKKAIEENNISKAIELAKKEEDEKPVEVTGEGNKSDGNATIMEMLGKEPPSSEAPVESEKDKKKREREEKKQREKEEKEAQKMLKKAKSAENAKPKANGGVGIWKTNHEMYDEFIKNQKHPLEAAFGNSGLSLQSRLAIIGAHLFGIGADGIKGSVAGFRGQPLPEKSTLDGIKMLNLAWDNTYRKNARLQKIFDTENQGKIDQADRVAKIKNSLFLQGWPEKEISDLAYQLQGSEMTEDKFKERYFGKTEDEQIKNFWEKRGKYPRSEEELNEYMNAAYNDYKNARVTYTPGSVGRQNLQTEKINEQSIQKNAVDLAYYGAEKDFTIKQDASDAQAELQKKIQEIDALEVQINKAKIGEFINIYSSFINMADGIVNVTQSSGSTGGVGANVAIPGIGGISANFNKTSGMVKSTDAWRQANQGNAAKAAGDWQTEYKKLVPLMIQDLEAAKAAYQKRIDELEVFKKNLPVMVGGSDERLKVIRQKLGYDGSGKYNRDPQYYINRLKGGMA